VPQHSGGHVHSLIFINIVKVKSHSEKSRASWDRIAPCMRSDSPIYYSYCSLVQSLSLDNCFSEHKNKIESSSIEGMHERMKAPLSSIAKFRDQSRLIKIFISQNSWPNLAHPDFNTPALVSRGQRLCNMTSQTFWVGVEFHLWGTIT
jgi:hypothetical protein